MATLAEAPRWASAVQSGSFGVWDLDPVLELVHYSPAWKRRLGFPDPTLPDSTSFWRCRVHPDDLLPMMDALRAHFDRLTDTYEMTFRLRSNGSGYRTVVSRGRVVARDESGHVTRMVGTMGDITDRPAALVPGLPERSSAPLPASGARVPLHMLIDAWSTEAAADGTSVNADVRERLLAAVADLLDMALRQSGSSCAVTRS